MSAKNLNFERVRRVLSAAGVSVGTIDGILDDAAAQPNSLRRRLSVSRLRTALKDNDETSARAEEFLKAIRADTDPH